MANIPEHPRQGDVNSIDCVKAGYLIKKRAVWYLTPEGEDALKLGAETLLQTATQRNRKWRADNPTTTEEDAPPEEQAAKLPSYDDIEQRANEGPQQYINCKNAYEFHVVVES